MCWGLLGKPVPRPLSAASEFSFRGTELVSKTAGCSSNSANGGLQTPGRQGYRGNPGRVWVCCVLRQSLERRMRLTWQNVDSSGDKFGWQCSVAQQFALCFQVSVNGILLEKREFGVKITLNLLVCVKFCA